MLLSDASRNTTVVPVIIFVLACVFAWWLSGWKAGWGLEGTLKRTEGGEDDTESVWLVLTGKYLDRTAGIGGRGAEVYVGHQNRIVLVNLHVCGHYCLHFWCRCCVCGLLHIRRQN